MKQFIVTVKYDNHSIFEKKEKFRVNATDELQAKRIILGHPYYPKDGEIISVKEARYYKHPKSKK